jgi:hypothetical protein
MTTAIDANIQTDLAKWSEGAMGSSPAILLSRRVYATGMSATPPKATDQPADSGRNQEGSDGLLPDILLAGAHYVVDFDSSLFIVGRRILTHLPEFLLGSIFGDAAHFLDIFLHFYRLFAKPFAFGRHACAPSQQLRNHAEASGDGQSRLTH